MASGDRRDENSWDKGKDKPGPLKRHLSVDDIGNQARYLINQFIRDRMEADHVENIPSEDVFIEPGTPQGPPVEQIQEVARALRVIGDELDRDERLNRMIADISPDSPQQTFMNVARQIFADGVFNWGRVVALFYFGYKMVVKAINSVPLIRTIIDWIVGFIIDYVAPWILERGGWAAIREYFGTPATQAMAVFASGFIISALYVVYKNLR